MNIALPNLNIVSEFRRFLQTVDDLEDMKTPGLKVSLRDRRSDLWTHCVKLALAVKFRNLLNPKTVSKELSLCYDSI